MGLSLNQACKLYHVGYQRLYDLEEQGLLHPVSVGQYVYYSKAELDASLGRFPLEGAAPPAKPRSRNVFTAELLTLANVCGAHPELPVERVFALAVRGLIQASRDERGQLYYDLDEIRAMLEVGIDLASERKRRRDGVTPPYRSGSEYRQRAA